MSTTRGAAHKSQQKTVTKSFDRISTIETYQGDEANIESLIGSYSIGQQVSDSVFSDKAIVTSISSRRLNGKVCEASIQKTQFIKKAVWGIDFHALSKPTITFRYAGENDETVNARAHRIRGWEALRDANRMPEYLEFKFIKYDDEHEEIGVGDLSGGDTGCGTKTLKIAQKIMRGQETYMVYYPVVTCTRTSSDPFTDDLNTIGTQCQPNMRNGWTSQGDAGQITAALKTKQFWVKTADNIVTNPDGSFTRREQWTGMDDLDKDFYPER